MDENYRHCEALVRAADKDRFLATLFAPAAQRRPLFALYAFNVEMATVRDRAREPMPGEIRLRWWRDVLAGERAGEAAANPVSAALIDTIKRLELPVAPLLDLIEAHAFDLYDDPMPTMDALEAYLGKTSGTKFACAALICGGRAGDAAKQAGLAWGLGEILRSFSRHASRQQLFVPADLLRRHGGSEEDILAGHATPAIMAALSKLREQARRHLAAFDQTLSGASAAAIPALLPVALVPGYLAATERIADPFKSAVEVAQWRRQWALWRAARRYSRAARG